LLSTVTFRVSAIRKEKSGGGGIPFPNGQITLPELRRARAAPKEGEKKITRVGVKKERREADGIMGSLGAR